MPCDPSPPSSAHKVRGYAIHVYTASGVFFAYLATREIISATCDPRWVFCWLLAAVVVDATDGPLARRFHVPRVAPSISGRAIDDFLDYLTFVFIPLMLVERMQWMPPGWGWTVALAMGASLLGFSHVNAKFDEGGFFRGFPSYWNIFVYYGGWISTAFSPWITAVMLWLLTLLTVSPVRMLYPNRAPEPWRLPILAGSGAWALLLLAMLPTYPRSPFWLVMLSLVYPACYLLTSLVCDYRARRREAEALRTRTSSK